MRKLAVGSMITLSLMITACNTQAPKDTTKPTVALASDKTSLTSAGGVKLTATATDNVGVVKVEFHKNGTKVFEDTTAPYEYTVNYTAGTKTVDNYTAVAFDKANNNQESTKVAIDVNIPGLDEVKPTVALVADKTEVTQTGDVKFTATATDNVGVVKVEFYQGQTKVFEDISAPYEYTESYTSAKNGDLSYTAKAYDAANNVQTSSNVSVKVNIPNPALASAAAEKDAAIMMGLPQELNEKTKKAMLALGVTLPTAPALSKQLMNSNSISQPLGSLLNLNVNQMLGITPMGTPDNPDQKLERGTYVQSSNGDLIQISPEPTNGKIVNSQINGVNFSQKTIYKEIKVISTTYNGNITYSEYLVDADVSISTDGTEVFLFTYDTSGSICTVQYSNSSYQIYNIESGLVSLNIGDQILGQAQLSSTGTNAKGNAEVSIITTNHKVNLKIEGNIALASSLGCENLGKNNPILSGSLDVTVAVDNNSGNLKASLTNIKNHNTFNAMEADLAATLTYQTPQAFGTIATANGNIKDGSDLDTMMGDQVVVKLETPKGTVTTNLQNLLFPPRP